MKYTNGSFLGTPEVLKRKLGGELIVTVAIDSTAFDENGVLPAGSAVAENGKASSGDGSDVFGITLNDCTEDNPNVAVIRAFATINTSNTTATSNDRAALTNLVFE